MNKTRPSLFFCLPALFLLSAIVQGKAQQISPALFVDLKAGGQVVLPYKDSTLSIEMRVNDLLSRMTPSEKFWQLFMIPGDPDQAKPGQYGHGIFGLQVSAAGNNAGEYQQILSYNTQEDAVRLAKKINAIQKYFVDSSRLGIPVIFFDEALHGLVREGATSFPQAIALAAAWDTALMSKVATAIAAQAKMRGIRQVLSPVVNIASDVRWGRTEETYGEDPFLTSAMAVAFISAFEKMNIITTPKHFVANVGDGGRDSYPIHFNERWMDEMYFPPFLSAIKKAGARSVMSAYNALDGRACSANSWLLTDVLKRKWGFNGFVISDANAVGGSVVLHHTAKDYPESGLQAINAGLDVIFQTDYDHYKLFIDPFLDGSIDSSVINEAVRRVLRAKFELGLFERPYVTVTELTDPLQESAFKSLAREAAAQSVVLLKNDKSRGTKEPVLPLNQNIRSIAVIGTDAVEARLGGYSGPGNNKISILDGIKKRAGNTIQVMYVSGCDRSSEDWSSVPGKYLSCNENGKPRNGLKASYFNNIGLNGAPAVSRIDESVDYSWTISSPDPRIKNDFFSVRWEGFLRAPKSGLFNIGLKGNDGFRLYLDDRLIVDKWNKQTFSEETAGFNFQKGKTYKIRIEFYEPAGNAHINLIWNAEVKNDWKNKIKQAVDAASKASVAIVVTGIKEGEFQDRAFLSLPGHQEELIAAIAATGKPVVVILTGGSAVTMSNWLSKVDGVLEVWYPGEEGGNAVADILFGDKNPAGRLPITFPVAEGQLPLFYNHKPTGRGDDYNDLPGLPLFPFGFGLSYTKFEYSNLHFAKDSINKDDSTTVSFVVKNTGSSAGDEVVQMYISDLLSSVARPVTELKGFQRVHLLPGEEKKIAFSITPELLSMLNKELKEVVEPGDFSIRIGASSRDIRLMKILTVYE